MQGTPFRADDRAPRADGAPPLWSRALLTLAAKRPPAHKGGERKRLDCLHGLPFSEQVDRLFMHQTGRG
jgi:hypothetical protein